MRFWSKTAAPVPHPSNFYTHTRTHTEVIKLC